MAQLDARAVESQIFRLKKMIHLKTTASGYDNDCSLRALVQKSEAAFGSWPNSHLAAPFGWPRSTLVMDLLFEPCKAKAKAEVVMRVRVPQAQTRKNLQFAAKSAENVIDKGSPQIHIFLTPTGRVPTGLEGAATTAVEELPMEVSASSVFHSCAR